MGMLVEQARQKISGELALAWHWKGRLELPPTEGELPKVVTAGVRANSLRKE